MSLDHPEVRGHHPTLLVLDEVQRERERQEAKCRQMRAQGEPWRSAGDPLNTDDRRLAILGEEFGEVAREVCDAHVRPIDRNRLRAELVQLAAVAVAWVEAIDGQGSAP